MKNIKNGAQNKRLTRVAVSFAMLFVVHIFPMMQPKSSKGIGQRALKGYVVPKKQPEAQMSAEQKKALEEAFMSDEQLQERRKQEAMQKAAQRIMAEKGEGLFLPSHSEKREPVKQMNAKEKREVEELFMSEEQMKAKRKAEFAQQREQWLQQQRKIKYPDKYFIYISGYPDEGILVDKEVVQNTSKSLKEMIEDVGGDMSEIPLVSSLYSPSMHIIKLAFAILEQYHTLGDKLAKEHYPFLTLEELKKLNVLRDNYLNEISLERLSNEIDISQLSWQELIALTNIFHFLDVPKKVIDLVLYEIKISLKHDDKKVAELKILNSDLQKILMVNPTIDYLKNFIIKKYMQGRKQVLIDYACNVVALAVSPDSTKIVSIERISSGALFSANIEVILWDISDPNNITKRSLYNYEGNIAREGQIAQIKFSSDGKKLVSCVFSGNILFRDNILLWDMNDLDNPKPLIGYQGSIESTDINSDGTKIVACSSGNQNNLIVWDITDPNSIIHQSLVGHALNSVVTVAFHPDGKRIISGSKGEQNNLILWNTNGWGRTNPDAVITHQSLDGHLNNVTSVAFSNDGNKIASACRVNAYVPDIPDYTNNVLLWDISDPDHIVNKWLKEETCCNHFVDFSSDSKSLVVYSHPHSNTIRLWDISDFKNISYSHSCQILEGHSNDVLSVKFSSDSKRILSGGKYGGYLTGNNLILWDVNDKNNVTHQVFKGHPFGVTNVLFSSDDKEMISAGGGRYDNLILWTLLTDQEEQLLNQFKSYTADQVRLIYQLCLKALKGETVSLQSDSEEQDIFTTLPDDMKKLLQDLFFSKRWLSGWW